MILKFLSFRKSFWIVFGLRVHLTSSLWCSITCNVVTYLLHTCYVLVVVYQIQKHSFPLLILKNLELQKMTQNHTNLLSKCNEQSCKEIKIDIVHGRFIWLHLVLLNLLFIQIIIMSSKPFSQFSILGLFWALIFAVSSFYATWCYKASRWL